MGQVRKNHKQTIESGKRRTKTKGWSEERRARQAVAIRRWKPWEKSTGPKTEKGKEAVRYNAVTHGARTAELEAVRYVLRVQRRNLKALMDRMTVPRLPRQKKISRRRASIIS